MGMGIVSDDLFDSELTSLTKNNLTKNKTNQVNPRASIIDSNIRGRGENNVAVPDALRKVIGETSILDGRQAALELADKFGISASSVSAYANGSTSTASYDKKPNESHLDQVKERISKKARITLFRAMDQITPAKLANTKAKDLSGVARDMSAIIKNMEPESPIGNGNNINAPTFVFYAPQPKSEDTFDVIYSKE